MEYLIQAHKYNTEQEANDALALVNTGEGYGTEGRETETYTLVREAEDSYFIVADGITRKYLTDETTITITTTDND